LLGANGKPPEFPIEDDQETQKQNEVKHEEADEAEEEEVGKRGMFLKQKKQKQSEPENGELTLSSSSAMSVEESDETRELLKDWQKPQGWKDPLFEDGNDPWKHCQ